jgi:hypothetical protein
MEHLFAFRKMFRRIGRNCAPKGTTSSNIITWVDVILAKLSEAVAHIASGECSGSRELSCMQAFRDIRAEDRLRACTQLPGNFFFCHSLIGTSNRGSRRTVVFSTGRSWLRADIFCSLSDCCATHVWEAGFGTATRRANKQPIIEVHFKHVV